MILTDAKKHGNVIARMQRDILSFEKAGLRSETLDEIVLTAVALAEHVRRNNRKKSDEGVLGLDIAGFLADGGGSGGDGGSGGSGGDGGGCSGGGGGDGGGGGGGS